MKRLLTLVGTDLRQIYRDKTLTVFLITPALLVAFVRLFVPFITTQYPEVSDYHTLIMMFVSMQTAILFGFIVSFLILEEKDENVLQVIRVLPISSFYFVLYRLLFAVVFSALGALVMINLGGIAYPGELNAALLSVQYGLAAPFITLVVATYANNKIEGMAFFKGIDLVLLLPVLSFFVPEPFKYLFSIIPSYWTYTLYEVAMEGALPVAYFLAGLGVYTTLIIWLSFQFKKRVFDR